MSASEVSPGWALVSIETQTLKAEEGCANATEVVNLTRAMVRGSDDAWVTFHRDFRGRIHRYLLVLLRGDHDMAGELLQVTLTRIVRHIRVFADGAILWHWITRIARTVVIDELRKTGRRRELIIELACTPSKADQGDEYWAELLTEALKRLEPNYCELLSGKYFDGLSVREFAAAHAESEKAVESRLVRARQKLREVMLELLQRDE